MDFAIIFEQLKTISQDMRRLTDPDALFPLLERYNLFFEQLVQIVDGQEIPPELIAEWKQVHEETLAFIEKQKDALATRLKGGATHKKAVNAYQVKGAPKGYVNRKS